MMPSGPPGLRPGARQGIAADTFAMIEDTTLVDVLRLLSDGARRTWRSCLTHVGADPVPMDSLTQRMLVDHGVQVSPSAGSDIALQIPGAWVEGEGIRWLDNAFDVADRS